MMTLLDALLDIAPLTGDAVEDARREAAAERILKELPAIGAHVASYLALDEAARGDARQRLVQRLIAKGPRRNTMANPPADEDGAIGYIWKALRNAAIDTWRGLEARKRAAEAALERQKADVAPAPLDWEALEQLWDRITVTLVERARTDDAADNLAEDLRQVWALSRGDVELASLAGDGRTEGAAYDRVQKRIYRARKRVVAVLDEMAIDDPGGILQFRSVFSGRLRSEHSSPRRRS